MTNPLMDLVFNQDFATVGPGADADVKPIPKQYAIQPGDFCVALTSDSIVDKELSMIKVLSPEDHKDTFPDYEDRLMKSYVLCDWTGQMDPIPAIGWFSRSRLIPLTEEEYTEITEGMTNPKDLEFPQWFMDKFQEVTDEMAKAQPEMVARRATCGKCGGRNVMVHWEVTVKGHSPASTRKQDGKDIYVPVTDDSVATWTAHLHCTDCKAVGSLNEEEFEKPSFGPTLR